jgi:hypothetical protein
LQHTKQPVYIAVPQINFGVNVQFQDSWFLSPDGPVGIHTVLLTESARFAHA